MQGANRSIYYRQHIFSFYFFYSIIAMIERSNFENDLGTFSFYSYFSFYNDNMKIKVKFKFSTIWHYTTN